MLEEFEKYLASACGRTGERNFLVAVSGGIDSVVMAHLFKSAGLTFAIAHCNFQLRNTESDDDQQFVTELAGQMQVPVHAIQFNTLSYSDEHGISVQMAARQLRYDWFEELSAQHDYDFIAVGHNKNDIVETVLLNLSRGTGIRGLMGIRTINKNIVRPLLFATRRQIEEYATAHQLQWREDSSNQETKYRRNKIRHTILPAFESINPAFMQNALETIQRIEQTGKLLDLVLKQIKAEVWTELPDRILINTEKLKKYPSHPIVLFELLREFGVEQLSGEMLIHSIGSLTGKQFHTRTHTFTHDRVHLIITPNEYQRECETVIGSDTVLVNYPIRLFFSSTENSEGFKIPQQSNMAALDADKVIFPLILRGWRTGDRFQPLGMKGSKKISDFLINIKVPLPDKRRVWILESDGKIAWVINHRIDNRFKVTTQTRKILLIDYKE